MNDVVDSLLARGSNDNGNDANGGGGNGFKRICYYRENEVCVCRVLSFFPGQHFPIIV